MTEPTVPTLPARVPPASPVGSGRFAQGTLFGFIGVEVILLIGSIVTLLRWETREIELSRVEPVFADGWDTGVGLAAFGIVILAGIAWLIWQFQAHANLSRLATTRFRSSAAFLILVPIASLFLPYQAIGELARSGTDRPALRRLWWALYLTMNFSLGVSSILALAGYPYWSTVVGALSALIGIGAAASAMQIIALVNAGLEERRAAAGWPLGPPPLSRRMGALLAGGAAVLTVMGGGLFGFLLPEIIKNLPAVPETNLAFAVGGCFSEGDDEYLDVSCDEPHEAETYRVLEHPESSAYPGAQLIEQWAEPQCYSNFEAYTGVPYQDSSLEFGYLYPTAQGWRAGDREVICYLFDPSGDDLTGPVSRPTA